MTDKPDEELDETAEAGDDSEVRKALSAMRVTKQAAPPQFDQDVTDIIRKRSRGAFFARRTFGDRVPFGALLVVAVLALAGIGYVMWSSQTGSLKRDPPAEGSGAGSGSAASIRPSL